MPGAGRPWGSSLERGQRIGFQGEPGAFSESAVCTFDRTAEAIPRPTFQAVIDALEAGEDDLGMLPVENSLAGAVSAAWDVLADGRVRVVGEVIVPVHLCLLGLPGAEPEAVREARSHPVALAQCQRFLRTRPGLRVVAVEDTAGAAREVARLGDAGLAAIASAEAGERYGLTCLARDIQDSSDNQTRFFVVRHDPAADPELAVRTSPMAPVRAPAQPPLKSALVAVTDDRPGALRDLLAVFADRQLDLSHIASRPGGTPWTYAFVLEIRHASPAELNDALRAASAATRSIRVLGTFPAALRSGQ